MTCEKPVVSAMTSRYCGRCGANVMFDPRTLQPYHVFLPAWVRRALDNTLPPKEYAK